MKFSFFVLINLIAAISWAELESDKCADTASVFFKQIPADSISKETLLTIVKAYIEANPLPGYSIKVLDILDTGKRFSYDRHDILVKYEANDGVTVHEMRIENGKVVRSVFP